MEQAKDRPRDEFPLNQRMTSKLQEDEKYGAYVQWAQKNGAIMDKITFPAVFGNSESKSMVGSAAREEIKHNEAFIFIPSKLLITLERAQSSEIGQIFENHDSIFKANEDRDFLTLLLFVMYEHQKGSDSFWHPYFEAIDPGVMTCYWDDKVLDTLDDQELKNEIAEYRKSMDDDWKLIGKLLKIYSPQFFKLEVCTFELYQRCAAFISTRCFGWGLPTTIVAPIADSFNHSSKSSQVIDFVNKRLHLQQNKLYCHQFDFNQDSASSSNDTYEEHSSKLKFNVKRLFKEDQIVQEDAEQVKLISGEEPVDPDSIPNRYKVEDVFQRFKNLMRAAEDSDLQQESEEAKKERFPDHGLEIWGIGYITSDHSEDEDEEETEESNEDCAYNEDLRRKILSYASSGGQVEFDMEEFESISSNTRLREIYSYRWWQDKDEDTYFVMVNKSGRSLPQGEQIYYNYGRRNNSYLLQNYGFVLDDSNQYNTMHLRVTLGTNPKLAINHVSELFPDQKVLEDKDNLETTTEILKLAGFRPSESLMNYLRSVLQNNYAGPDKDYIMISSPRIIEFELLVVEFAISLLEHYGQSELFKRSTLEEDTLRSNAVTDYRMRTVILYNVERKKLYLNHLKLLRVMKAILERIGVSKEPFSQASVRRVEGVEDSDNDQVVFRRRMGLRHYFKDLKMNMTRIQKSKGHKDPEAQLIQKAKKKVVKDQEAVAKEKQKVKKPVRDSSKSKVTESKGGSTQKAAPVVVKKKATKK